jgi:RNA polymerase sigma-32 factor
MTNSLPVPQKSLSSYLIEINRFPLLKMDEEQLLAIRYRETGDIEAAHQLVISNLRFVVKIAQEYRSYGMRMSDLIQEGNVGLMTAVKKFDPSKGYRLISYAVWWIRAMIQNFILKSWSLVKIGTTQAQRKLFYKLGQTKRALAKFFDETDASPESVSRSISQSISKVLKVREEDVVEMDQRMSGRDASLDQPAFATVSGGEGPSHLDLLASASEGNQEALLIRAEKNATVGSQVRSALTGLNEKERFIVEKRLMTDEPLTLQEIGDRYHISRERARQLEERAKKKLRVVFSDFAKESL